LIDKRAARDFYEHYSRAAFHAVFFDRAVTVIWSPAWNRNLHRCDAASDDIVRRHAAELILLYCH
jgi:hypothetical protein